MSLSLLKEMSEASIGCCSNHFGAVQPWAVQGWAVMHLPDLTVRFNWEKGKHNLIDLIELGGDNSQDTSLWTSCHL